MKKKILGMIMMTAVALAAAGCGSSEAADVQANADNNANTEAADGGAEAVSSLEEEQAAQDVTVEEEAVPLAAQLDPNTEYVFGTASLSYADFYAGDVSSTDSYDVVSSATAKKYEIFPNMDTDYVDETTNADGYHILGVKNVNVAVPKDQVSEYAGINETFTEAGAEAPSQYKIVSVEGGKATYSATVFNVADTITDAEVELATGTNWGDYQLEISETSTAYIRNTREEGDFAIDSNVYGVILETESGLKVGMEHLQNIWVMPGEVAFNISADNSHNSRMVADNLPELDKLEKENIVAATFINQNDAYRYEFAPVYVKPVYRDVELVGVIDEEKGTFTTSGIPEDLENPTLTVTYIVGKGHDAVRTVIVDGEAAAESVIDTEALSEAKNSQEEEGRYTAVIESDNYANISVKVE